MGHSSLLRRAYAVGNVDSDIFGNFAGATDGGVAVLNPETGAELYSQGYGSSGLDQFWSVAVDVSSSSDTRIKHFFKENTIPSP